MHCAGMVGMVGEGLFENCGSFQLIGVGLVGRWRERGHGIAIENLRLRIVWILVVDLLQRVSIGVHALFSVSLVRVPVERLGGRDVVLFARGLRAEGFGPLHEIPAL